MLPTRLWLVAAMVLSASAPAAEMSAPDALAAQRDGRLTLVDVRTPPEWKETGVAVGARRIDMYHPGGPKAFVTELLKAVDGNRDAPIGIICRTGNRTTMLEKYLEAQGFTRLYNVREGMAGSAAGPGWLRRGLPVEPCPC